MTTHEFCDHCPGCRPVLFDPVTGAAVSEDSPLMIAVNRAWRENTSYAERKAFIDVTVHNSREPQTLTLAQAVVQKLELAARAV